MFSDTNLVTLTSYILETQKKKRSSQKHQCAHGTSDLAQLFNCIQTAVKAIRTACTTHFGDTDKVNVQNETVKKLDIFANEMFINMLKSSFATCLLVSEENEDVIEVESANQGRYIVCFDPVDGSSNVDCCVAVGTIFAIFKKHGNEKPCLKDVLKSGKDMVAAGYALYSTSTRIVLSLGDGVCEFFLDPILGEFLLAEKNITIPNKGNIYSINEGNESKWEQSIKEYIQLIKDSTKGKPYSNRYIGSMVADIHRTIKYGGIYLYPVLSDKPDGKLRLMYECNPMAFLITQAGGLASNGCIPILDIVPESIHQRSPIYIGSKENVEEVVSIIKKYNK